MAFFVWNLHFFATALIWHLLVLHQLSIKGTALSMMFSFWGWKWSSEAPPTPKSSSPSSIVSRFDSSSPFYLHDKNKANSFVAKVKAKSKEHTCWDTVYSNMGETCQKIEHNDQERSRFAMALTNCFLIVTGREAKPCSSSNNIKQCTSSLEDHVHEIYASFFVESTAMCDHLQAQSSLYETSRVVNDLKFSAHWMDEHLEGISERFVNVLQKADNMLNNQQKILQGNKQLQKNFEKGLNGLKTMAKGAHDHIEDVAELQLRLARHQSALGSSLISQLTTLENSASLVWDQAMQNLQNQASLADSQTESLSKLSQLQDMQLSAMLDSKTSLDELANEAQRHREEFLAWQHEMESMQQHLAERSQMMLDAQLRFLDKQTEVFQSLDNLFALHDGIVAMADWSTIKALVFYLIAGALCWIFTMPKQTMYCRGLLYCVLSATYMLEVWIAKLHGDIHFKGLGDIYTQVYWTRSGFVTLGAGVLLYSLITYKDYSVLNYKLLEDLSLRLNYMQGSMR